jgi:uncharacterized repeat protein (TIGR01451 family)
VVFLRFGPAVRLCLAGAVLVATFALAWVEPAHSYSSKLRRYPYLTDVVGGSATINWATDQSSTAGSVKYGKVVNGSCTATSKLASKTTITVNSVPLYQWKARLTVEPDTEYCYRVYLGSAPQEDLLAEDPSPRFFSQIPAGSTKPFSFGVLGDWGQVNASGANPDQANVLSQIAQSGVRFVLTPGDNTHPNSSQASYGDLVQVGSNLSAIFGPSFWKVPGASIPIFPALGNHGISTANTHFVNWPQTQAVFTSGGRYKNETYCCLNGTQSKTYGSAWYAFNAGTARFYVLQAAWSDTNVGTANQYKNDYDYHWTPTSAEYQWLANDLAAHPSELKFAFFHYPMYSDNKQNASDQFLQGRQSLEGLLSANGVDVVFNGHAHLYQRNRKAHPDSLVTYVTGGGGATLAPIGPTCSFNDAYGIGWSNSTSKGSACGAASRPTSRDQVFHFLKVSVNGAQVTVTPIDSLGRSFDEVTYDFGLSSDLSVTKSDLPDPVNAWDTLTYTATVRNAGPSQATGATYTEKLPAGVNYESVSSSQGACSHSFGTVRCNLGTLASDATATVELRVKPQDAGTLNSTATVWADEYDPDTTNNTVTEETTVEPAPGVLVFAPSDDAHVYGDLPSTNFGSAAQLHVDGSPARNILLKFAVSGVDTASVTSAKLRLYCVGAAVRSGGEFYRALDSGWLESTVTWDTAPAADSVRLASLGRVSAGNWYEVDVTPLVTGDGDHSLRVTSPSSDGAEYSSEESVSGFAPQLVVTTG